VQVLGNAIDGNPEKAGVGGSTPSLATIFSISSKPSKSQSCSKMFQLAHGVCLSESLLSAGFRGSRAYGLILPASMSFAVLTTMNASPLDGAYSNRIRRPTDELQETKTLVSRD